MIVLQRIEEFQLVQPFLFPDPNKFVSRHQKIPGKGVCLAFIVSLALTFLILLIAVEKLWMQDQMA